MMNAVDRHISVSTTSPSSQFEWFGSIQIVGWSIIAEVLQNRVQVAVVGEDLLPDETRREVGHGERQDEDEEDQAAPLQRRVDDQGHHERDHELQRHDHDDEQQREPERMLELGVVVHALERGESTSCPPRPGRRAGTTSPSARRRRRRGSRAWAGSASTADPANVAAAAEPALLARLPSPPRPELVRPDLAGPGARRIGLPARRSRRVEHVLELLALVVQDLVDVLLVDHDPRERVGEDAVVVAALTRRGRPAGATPSASFDRCCVFTAAAIASRPGPTCFESRWPDDREEACDLRQPSPAGRRRRGTRSAAFAPAAFGAVFGIARPASTGRYARPFGPGGRREDDVVVRVVTHRVADARDVIPRDHDLARLERVLHEVVGQRLRVDVLPERCMYSQPETAHLLLNDVFRCPVKPGIR